MNREHLFSKGLALAIIAATSLIVGGCPEPHLKTGYQGVSANGFKACDVSLSYASVKPILKARCQRCHQAGTKNSVAFYTDVFRIRQTIREDLLDGSMPKEGEMPEVEKKLLVAWVEQNAPEESNMILACPPVTSTTPAPIATPTPLPAPTPSGVFTPRSYNEIREKILKPKCLDCHSDEGDAFLYDFTKYKYMMMSADIFDLQNPRNSQIVKSVLKVGKGQMPSVKSKIPRLTPEEVLSIIEWIEQGLPEEPKPSPDLQ